MASNEEGELQRRKAYQNTLKDLKRQAKKERDNPDELIYETMMKQLYPSAKEQYRDMKEMDTFIRQAHKIHQRMANLSSPNKSLREKYESANIANIKTMKRLRQGRYADK